MLRRFVELHLLLNEFVLLGEVLLEPSMLELCHSKNDSTCNYEKIVDRNNEIHYHETTMKKIFEALKSHFGTHKAAAAHLGVSYTRYNEWRWRPEEIPLPMQNYLRLVVSGLPSTAKLSSPLTPPESGIAAREG